jgi:GINS complex subunit 1
MNYGQRAKELILDLKRSDWLPAYNEEGVRATLAEVQHAFEDLNDQVHASNASRTVGKDSSTSDGKPAMQSRPAMILHDTAIRRSKRCLLAYHAFRLEKLRSLRWDTTASLPTQIRSLLSEAEIDFFSEYERIISRYNTSLSIDGALDLNANMQPPEEDLVEVRVVQGGLGTIVTDHWGEVSLDLGTTHFLSRGDVEHLIRQGALHQLDAEESF